MSHTLEILKTVLACVGALVVAGLARSAVDFAALHFWRPSRPLARYKRDRGDAYALVTGASAGIGLGVGRALVQQGFGVVLLGHLADELSSAADALIAENPAAAGRVRTLVLDARAATPEDITAAVASISHLAVSVLVNNVGSASLVAPPFQNHAALALADVDAYVDLNARFMARLTNRVLPLLVSSRDRSPGERSLILNVSSAGRVGLPWLVMYGATKAFNYAFSAGLARELEDDPATAHVDCLAVVPGDVRSQSNVAASPASAPTSDEFGRAIVGSVDAAVRRGWREVRPDWRHDLSVALMDRVLPERAMTYFVREELRAKKIRGEAALKKE